MVIFYQFSAEFQYNLIKNSRRHLFFMRLLLFIGGKTKRNLPDALLQVPLYGIKPLILIGIVCSGNNIHTGMQYIFHQNISHSDRSVNHHIRHIFKAFHHQFFLNRFHRLYLLLPSPQSGS